MNKTVNDQDIAALAQWKAEDEELHRKRTELFVRLYANGKGLSQQRIADIYGCKRQYVQQEIEKAQA